jgi:hypothetical protein
MRSGGRIVVLASAAMGVLFPVACSSFGSSDPAPTPDAGEASNASDASASVDALLVEDFEVEKGGCGAWMGKQTIPERVADAGTDGSFACRVCTTVGKGAFFALMTSLGKASGPPQAAYFIEANARVESGGATVGAAFDFAGSFYPSAENSAPGWQHVSHRVTPDGGVVLTGEVYGRVVTSPACIVIDDIVVRHVE